MEPPSQKLTARILQKLAAEGLLRDEDVKAFAPKIAAGTLKQEDWRLAVEKALEKKGAK
jgi:hypothetical protein